MSVLITVRNGQQLLGRCDATCYDAKGTRCRCICEGLNHARGLETARLHTAATQTELAQQIKRRFPEATLITFYQAEIPFHFHAPQPNPHVLPTPEPYILSALRLGSIQLKAVMFPVQKNANR